MASQSTLSPCLYLFLVSALVQPRVAVPRQDVIDSRLCVGMECADTDSTETVALLQTGLSRVIQRQTHAHRSAEDWTTEDGWYVRALLDGHKASTPEAAAEDIENIEWAFENDPDVARVGVLMLLDGLGYNNARCLDGSPAGYYFRKATSDASSKRWIIHMEGGGECVNERDCTFRTNTSIGSSKNWPLLAHLTHFLHDEADANFASWNAVVISYCSGDAWTGTQTALGTTIPGVRFSGHHILEATIHNLKGTQGLTHAEEVILAGNSVGGLAAFNHIDYLRKQLPRVPRVVAASFGGYWFPQSEGELLYTGKGHIPVNVSLTPADMKSYYELWSSYVHEGCAEQNNASPWMCLYSSTVYEFLKTPVFLAHAQFDFVSMQAHCGLGGYIYDEPYQNFTHSWNAALDHATKSLKNNSRDGFFLPACLMHDSFTPTIAGRNANDVFVDWYFKSGPATIFDSCHDISGHVLPFNFPNCNPSCASTDTASSWTVLSPSMMDGWAMR